MQPKNLDANELCGVAQVLARMGDAWSLLIVRDAFFGLRRFKEFEASLGISKNILAARLRKLVEFGILERDRLDEPGQRYAYTLTPKGRDLWTVLTAMRLWSDKWVFGEDEAPLVAVEQPSGRRLAKLIAADAAGQPINLKTLRWQSARASKKEDTPS